ncbi:MAG: phosphatidylglycerophosphatase A [Rhodospirillales bacterium]|nr:phosphatidylglycerophosphatase A [Rhodospirillales bacterium]
MAAPLAEQRGARLLVAGFGCGLIPRAPGTAASAAATIAAAGLIGLSPWLLAAAAIAALGAGLWAIPRAAPTGDPGWVVIDEIAGQWVALLGLSQPSLPGLLAGFVLFRALDILKPGPVGAVQRFPGALGVLADDVLAGGIAAILLLLGRLALRRFSA